MQVVLFFYTFRLPHEFTLHDFAFILCYIHNFKFNNLPEMCFMINLNVVIWLKFHFNLV